MTRVRTIDGDVLDDICWRHYGREDAVPDVLRANPGLADAQPVLPAGQVVLLPDLPPPPEPDGAVVLWGAP